MTVLVTGASGVVGKAMKAKVSNFCFVTSRDADLTDPTATESLISEIKPHSIIHLAAMSGGVQLSRQRPADMFIANTMMAVNIFKSAYRNGITRIGFALSGAAYGSKVNDFAEETQLHAAPILEEDFAYGYAKRGIEILIRAMNSQYGLTSYSFVINGAIGPGMNYEPDKSIVVSSLIKRIYEARSRQDAILVWGDGSPRRQYTWSGDLARNILWCHENQMPGTVLNIGTNEVVTIKSLANLICKEFGVDERRLYFDIDKGNGKDAQLTDSSVFMKLTSYKFLSIEKSISKICASYPEVASL